MPAVMRFDVHPGVAMVRKWADELPTKTGHSLDEWAELLEETGLASRAERVEWLKENHRLGSNTAWQIAEYSLDQMTWDGDPDAYLRHAAAFVEGMFAGPRSGLRPIFEKLVAEGRKLGKDVKVCPCKTIVPFYRRRVFAEVKPATRTRLEFALALGDRKPAGKLKPNPRAKADDRLKHLFELYSVEDVDATVLKWLKTAYDADA